MVRATVSIVPPISSTPATAGMFASSEALVDRSEAGRPRVARTTGTTTPTMMTAADAMRSRGTRQMVRSHSHAAPTSGMRERARQPAYNIVAEYVASTARATMRYRGRPALAARMKKEPGRTRSAAALIAELAPAAAMPR